MSPELVAAWRAAAGLELDAAIDLRHELHADPRVSGAEESTAERVAAAIGAGDGQVVADTGRLVDVAGDGAAAIVLRAELDALPIVEATEVGWRSRNGAMHACGHDVHLAALTAVARAARRVELPVRLLALLQPREESTHSGAEDVVAQGWADHWSATVAAHVQPQLEPGVLAATPGPVNASTSEFTLRVTGRGGHSGYPHTVSDSVLALSATVVALQQVSARTVDPVRGSVLMVNQFEAGSAANVVPPHAVARGTLRTMSAADQDRAIEAMQRVVTHTAAAHGCEGTLLIDNYDPVLMNDPGLATTAHALLTGMGHRVSDTWRSFGSDDFSHYGGRTRSLMIFVGTGRPGGGLHDPRYLPADAYIALVADALIAGYAAAVHRL